MAQVWQFQLLQPFLAAVLDVMHLILPITNIKLQHEKDTNQAGAVEARRYVLLLYARKLGITAS
jgi:hypothetical protein